jgi:hypothetical protein
MRLLHRLQGLVERTYDVANPHRVTDYLVTCPQLAASLGLGQAAVATGEQVLVSGDHDEVNLAVFLDRGLLDELRAENPMRALHDGNLDHFWTALEGISHFVYLVWSARMGRQVTRLELELQAEVDKFVLTAMLVSVQRGGRVPAELHRWLFDLPEIDPSLAAEAAGRYAEANRYAGRYCRGLARRYLTDGAGTSMMPELRRFYRLSQGGKIRRIEADRY